MEFFFQYEILYYDEIDHKETKAKGIVYAASYTQAVTKIEHYYGTDNIISLNNVTITDLNDVYEEEDNS